MSADRNLLLGIIALQMDFVRRDDLLAAMNAWLLAKHRPLGEILVERGALNGIDHDLLRPLVERHLANHGDNAANCLASLSSLGSTDLQALRAIPDDEVRATLMQVGADKGGNLGPRTVMQPPSEAKVAGRFRILRPHAKGGLGEVFIAEDSELGRTVALKEIQAQHADREDFRSRFVLEAEVTGGLEHPGIVPVYGLGNYPDGRPFYAMRFVRGDNLRDSLRQFHAAGSRFDSLEFRQLLRRFVDVCNAVAYAHSRGVLHRDLKPGNVMLGQYGETLVVDWGLAKVTGSDATLSERLEGGGTLVPKSGATSSATMHGHAMGTPAYMSPEQAQGWIDQLGPATDIFSLGATLYEVLTGETAYANDLEFVKRCEFARPRAVLATVPPPLEAVCLKAMAESPTARYASALELAAEVECWVADEPVSAYPEPMIARARRFCHRQPAFSLFGASCAAVLYLNCFTFLAWKATGELAIAQNSANCLFLGAIYFGWTCLTWGVAMALVVFLYDLVLLSFCFRRRGRQFAKNFIAYAAFFAATGVAVFTIAIVDKLTSTQTAGRWANSPTYVVPVWLSAFVAIGGGGLGAGVGLVIAFVVRKLWPITFMLACSLGFAAFAVGMLHFPRLIAPDVAKPAAMADPIEVRMIP